MSSVIVLEWKFYPPGYFESSIKIQQDNYTMTIDNGKVEVRIDSAVYEANPSIRDALQKVLTNRFLGTMLCSHTLYELSSPNMTRLHDDGRVDRFLKVEPGRIEIKGGHVDFKITDKDGNVVVDTKRDRIKKKKKISDLVSKHADHDLVLSLLRSYEDSIRDPNNELIYLYEIRDALSRKFGNSDKAISVLDLPKTKWKDFGKLCNKEPLKQGRHRGQHEALRNATDIELSEARKTAKTMIEAYLYYLESIRT